MGIACFEARILAFAAQICIQRWKQQRSAILRWYLSPSQITAFWRILALALMVASDGTRAVEAARICSARLNMPVAVGRIPSSG